MARAALQMGVRELAEAAAVSPTTITRLERGEALFPRTLEGVRAALEAAGVEFIAENGGGSGVRRRKPVAGLNCRHTRRWGATTIDRASARGSSGRSSTAAQVPIVASIASSRWEPARATGTKRFAAAA